MNLAAVTICSVRVRSAVDGRARRRDALVSSLGQQCQNGRDYHQHEDQTRDRDADGEAPLRNADVVGIVDSLQII